MARVLRPARLTTAVAAVLLADRFRVPALRDPALAWARSDDGCSAAVDGLAVAADALASPAAAATMAALAAVVVRGLAQARDGGGTAWTAVAARIGDRCSAMGAGVPPAVALLRAAMVQKF